MCFIVLSKRGLGGNDEDQPVQGKLTIEFSYDYCRIHGRTEAQSSLNIFKLFKSLVIDHVMLTCHVVQLTSVTGNDAL